MIDGHGDFLALGDLGLCEFNDFVSSQNLGHVLELEDHVLGLLGLYVDDRDLDGLGVGGNDRAFVRDFMGRDGLRDNNSQAGKNDERDNSTDHGTP